MPHFEPQLWNGYKFQLQPSGIIREWLGGFYFYRFIYFNGSRINFHLVIGLPRKKDTPKSIKYDWKLYDRETKEEVKLVGDWLKPTGSGLVLFSEENNKLKAKDSNGKTLVRWLIWDSSEYKMQLALAKAVQLGYWVDSAKYFIRMTFNIDGEVCISEPMALFTVFDREDFHKAIIEFGLGAVVGGIVAFILSRVFH